MSSYFNSYANYAANISMPMRTSLSCCRNFAQLLPVLADNEVILDADNEVYKNDVCDSAKQALHPKDLFGTSFPNDPTDTSICAVTSTHILSMEVPLAFRDTCRSGVFESCTHVGYVNKIQSSLQTTSLLPPTLSYRHGTFLAAGINGGFVVYEITERGAYDIVAQYQSNLIPNLVPNHLMHMISDQVLKSIRKQTSFEVIPTVLGDSSKQHLYDLSDLFTGSSVNGIDTLSSMESLVDRVLAASLSVPSTGNLLLQDSVSYKSPVISGIHLFTNCSTKSLHTLSKSCVSTENHLYCPLIKFITELERVRLHPRKLDDDTYVSSAPEYIVQKRLLQLILLPSICGHVARVTQQTSKSSASVKENNSVFRNTENIVNETVWFLNRCAAELQQKYAFEGTTVPTQRPTRFLDVAIVDETVDTANPIFLNLPSSSSLSKNSNVIPTQTATDDDLSRIPIPHTEKVVPSIIKEENLYIAGEAPSQTTVHYSNLIGGDESVCRGYRNPTHAITLVLLTDSFLHYGCSDALEIESKRDFSCDDNDMIRNAKHTPKSSVGIMEYHQRVMVVRCSHALAASNVKISLKGIMDFCKQEMSADWAEAMTESMAGHTYDSPSNNTSECDPRLLPSCEHPPYLRRYVDTEVMKKDDMHATIVDRILRKQLDTDFTFSRTGEGSYTLNESNLRRRYENILLQILNEGAMVYEVEREFTFKTWPLHTSLHIATHTNLSSERTNKGVLLNDPLLPPFVTPTPLAANSHQPFPSPQDTPRPACFLTSLKVLPRTVREVHTVLTISDSGSNARVQVVTANARRPLVVSGGTIVISGTSFHNSNIKETAMVGDVLVVLKPVEMTTTSKEIIGKFNYSYLNGLALTDVVKSEDLKVVNLKSKCSESTNNGTIGLLNSLEFSGVNNRYSGLRFRISSSSIFAVTGSWLALQGCWSLLPHNNSSLPYQESKIKQNNLITSQNEDVKYHKGSPGIAYTTTGNNTDLSDSFINSNSYPLIRSFYSSGNKLRLYSQSSKDYIHTSSFPRKHILSLLPPTTVYNDRIPCSEPGFVDSCCKMGKKEGSRWMNRLYSNSNSDKERNEGTDGTQGKVLLYSLGYNGPLHSPQHFHGSSVDHWEMPNESCNYNSTIISSSVFAAFTAHSHSIRQMSFDNSGTLLATVSSSGTGAKVFQITVEQRRRRYRHPSHQSHVTHSEYVETIGVVTLLHRLIRGTTSADITCITFSPLSTLVALSSGNGSVHFYSLNHAMSTTEEKDIGGVNRFSNWFEEDQNRALMVRGQAAFDHYPNEIRPICRARSGYWGTPHLMVCFRRLCVHCRPSCTTIQQSISNLKKAEEAVIIQKGQSLSDHKVTVACDELHDVVLWAPQSATAHYLQLATIICKTVDTDVRMDGKKWIYLPTQIKSLYSRILYPPNKSVALPPKCRLDLSLPFFMPATTSRSTEGGTLTSNSSPVIHGAVLPRIEGLIPILPPPHTRTSSCQTFGSGSNDDDASLQSTSTRETPRVPFAPTVTFGPDLDECAQSIRYLRSRWASAAGPSLYDRNEEIAAKAFQLNRIVASSADKIISDGQPPFVEPLYAIRVASDRNVTISDNDTGCRISDSTMNIGESSKKTDVLNTYHCCNEDDVLNKVDISYSDDLSTFWHQHTVTVTEGDVGEMFSFGGYKSPRTTENDIYGEELLK